MMAVSLPKGEGWDRETAPEVVTRPVKTWGKLLDRLSWS